ncbi:sensor histidine kinase [Halorubellus sp. PRR65]|uniref:sensor histidine kinase n=1 Tax=Halorubellus sp. PRR65 TaxID=3098148 RepID=UPI002B263A81|nr:sensor histidine kinase [Halorubellus sp. PRR65]
MRLSTTLVALLVALSLVLGITVYAGFALHTDDIVQGERASVNGTAATVAHNLHAQLESKEQVVRVGSRASGLARHGSAIQIGALDEFLAASRLDGASVVDANGTVTAFASEDTNATERERIVGGDLSHRRYVRVALNGTMHVSDPFRADSGNLIVVISAPIRDGTDVVGTLNAAIHLEDPEEDQHGVFSDISHLVDPGQTVTVRSHGTSLYAEDPLDGRTFRATEPVPQTDWVVVVEHDRSSVANRLRSVSLVQGVALLVVLCSVGAVGYWTYRTNIRQIADLRAGLTALESGEYDVDVALSGTEEWDEIGERFDRVGARLEQRESQLRVLNRVLRHNVRNEMNLVLGHSQSLREDDADVDLHVSAIEAAVQDTLEISDNARMIEDRIRAVTDRRAPAPLSSVVAEATATADAPSAANVTVDVPDGVVLADGDAVRTALAEIVENACIHNDRPPADRDVAITARDDDDHVRITVSDNGPGLPDIESDLLAGGLDASPVDHGDGLGHWIARWLVERADGTITTTTNGDGTVVHIDVPTIYSEN